MPTAVAGRAWLWNWLYDGTGFPRQKSAEAGQPHNPGVPRGGGGAAAAPTEISFTATEAGNLTFSFLQPLPTQQLTSRTSPLVGLSVCSLPFLRNTMTTCWKKQSAWGEPKPKTS